MRFLNRYIVWLLLGTGNVVWVQAQDTAGSRLDYKEVYDLIRSQLPDLEDSTLGDSAARGIIRGLSPRVQLVSDTNLTQSVSPVDSIRKATVWEGDYGYLLFHQIGPDTAQSFQSAFHDLASSNQIKGLVLDLRFAYGDDYEAVAQLADLFFAKSEPLLDWGKGVQNSRSKEQAIDLPLVILINSRTAGAAEALAAVLRQGVLSLLIGSPTAGQASVYRQFTLSTGQRLRIAAQPVAIGSKGQTVPRDGLVPDIPVAVPVRQEEAWLEDPYKVIAISRASDQSSRDDNTDSTSTNRTRRRINEADLVRMMEEGEMPGMWNNLALEAPDPEKPVLRDPVLARGLDFLKGLAVVRPFRAK